MTNNVYEMQDLISSVFRTEVIHARQDYSTMKMKYNSDNITIVPQMFIQIIGYYSADDQDRLFQGTYNFGDNEVGDDEDDIDFIDSYNLYDGDCRIVHNFDGHSKVLRLQDDATAAEDPYIIHNETQSLTGTREYWIGTNDVTEIWEVRYCENAALIIQMKISSSNLYYRANGSAWTLVQAVSNNTLYHIKTQWYADNTWDLWVDETQQLDGVAVLNNMTSGINGIHYRCLGDSEDYLYLDAYGDVDNDSDYDVGDNQYIEEGGENQVVFEGIAQNPTEGRIQFVSVINQASEIDKVKAKGSKSGRTDQIISNINDDGTPNGPSYIQDGTLSTGTAMGDQEVDGKKLRTLYDNYAENDGFTWSLKPQGQLDYNDGSIDSGADIRFDGVTYTDTITKLMAWKVAKNNQIIVNGAIDPSDGDPYTGQWDDDEDQQINGINSITIEDANLNSDALCQSKADTLGANETEITRVKFKFRKPLLGLIQPGQTITFLYDISNYITISEAQFIVDYVNFEIISEMGYMMISSAV